MLVRLFNPTSRDIEAPVTVGFDIDAAHVVKLTEARERPLEVSERTVNVPVRSGEILTMELTKKA